MAFGLMLDAMDVMLYSLVLTFLIREFAMDTRTAGLLNSADAGCFSHRRPSSSETSCGPHRTHPRVNGLGFSCTRLPARASRLLRTRFRSSQLSGFVLGLGMGGEWTTGAALIAETWALAEHRGKALGFMAQSAYAIGEAIAALIVALVLPLILAGDQCSLSAKCCLRFSFSGFSVQSPRTWSCGNSARRAKKKVSLRRLLEKGVLRNGILATTMNAAACLGYWGLFTWIPAYLVMLPPEKGGQGLSLVKTTGIFF